VHSLVLIESDGTDVASAYCNVSLGATECVELERDESVGTYGTLYCRVYPTPADRAGGTNILATLSVTLRAKRDYRYAYALQSYNDASAGKTLSGYSENLRMWAPRSAAGRGGHAVLTSRMAAGRGVHMAVYAQWIAAGRGAHVAYNPFASGGRGAHAVTVARQSAGRGLYATITHYAASGRGRHLARRNFAASGRGKHARCAAYTAEGQGRHRAAQAAAPKLRRVP
jgi:hypothetical protein